VAASPDTVTANPGFADLDLTHLIGPPDEVPVGDDEGGRLAHLERTIGVHAEGVLDGDVLLPELRRPIHRPAHGCPWVLGGDAVGTGLDDQPFRPEGPVGVDHAQDGLVQPVSVDTDVRVEGGVRDHLNGDACTLHLGHGLHRCQVRGLEVLEAQDDP